MNGKEDGFEPVAIIIFFASSVSEVPSAFSTATWVASINEPFPSKTVILFLSIKNLTPPEVWSTTACFRAIIFSKFTFTSPETSIPCSAK